MSSNGLSPGNGAEAGPSGTSPGSPSKTHPLSLKSTNGNGRMVENGSNGVSKAAMAAAIPPPETADYVGFRPIYPGSRVDRKELVRLSLQTLRELGYEASARTLEAEAGVASEHPSIIAFRNSVLHGDWKNAERFLIDGLTYAVSRQKGLSDHVSASTSASLDLDLVLRDPVNRPLDSIKFLIQQQRYLELLEVGQTKKALSVLRERLTPLNHGSDQLHQLSSLVMCNSREELMLKAGWDGSGPESRRKLLQQIELAVSPSALLPSRRLPQLLEQAQTLQKQLDPFFNLPSDSHVSLYVDHQSDTSIFPTQTTHVLRGHDDQVWVMAFSHDGRYLATGGKDKMVIVWSISSDTCEKVKVLGPHTAEVTCLAWSPDDRTLLASADREVYQWEWESEEHESHKGHDYTIFAVCWLPSGQGFVTGGTDAKIIFWDRHGRITHTWTTAPYRVLALSIAPDGRTLVALSWRPSNTSTQETNSSSDSRLDSSSGTSSSVNSYSPSPSPVGRRGVSEGAQSEGRSKMHFWNLQRKQEIGSTHMMEEMISVAISQDSRYALVNHRPNEAQLWDIEEQLLVTTYQGHRMQRDLVRACFGGSEQSFVASGSEDGSISIYHRSSGKLLEKLTGHGEGTVNTVAWHPKLPSLLASCSDDGTIRIWQPEQVALDKNRRRGGVANRGVGAGGIGGINGVGGGVNSRNSWGAGNVDLSNASASLHLSTTTKLSSSSSSGGGGGGGNGGVGEANDGSSSSSSSSSSSNTTTAGLAPFPWSMSPARPSSPDAEGQVEGEGEVESEGGREGGNGHVPMTF